MLSGKPFMGHVVVMLMTVMLCSSAKWEAQGWQWEGGEGDAERSVRFMTLKSKKKWIED